MNIQLKRFHLAFCLSYIPNLDSNKNFRLLEQINTLLDGWDGVEPLQGQEVVTLDIKGAVLADAWHMMATQQEGFTATIAREMSVGSEGFTGLETQLGTMAMQGDAEAYAVIQKIQSVAANYLQMRQEQIAANIVYLNVLFS